jgi:Uma2 family endonuclease
MLAQTKHRFSVSEYYRMAETGVLRPDARVELLDGEIIDMSPIGPFHGGVVNRLNQMLNAQARGRWLVTAQNPVHIDQHSEPEPDLMLLRPSADDYTKHHPGPRDVLLLIEVSDTTIEYDRGSKLSTYARAGIAEVWIVNLRDLVIEVYRDPQFDEYASSKVHRGGNEISPLNFPDVVLDVAALLKR